MAYHTNRDPSCSGPVLLQKGVHSLSNGVLSSEWPKTERIRAQLEVSFLLASYEALQGLHPTNLEHQSVAQLAVIPFCVYYELSNPWTLSSHFWLDSGSRQ